MRRPRPADLFLLWLALPLWACGSDAGPGPPEGGRGQDAADARADLGPEAAPALPVPVGQACELDRDCLSGICADGVCCGSPCSGSCRRCDLPGRKGQCSLLEAGAPCGGSICLAGKFLPQAICRADGSCEAPEPVGCTPFRCLENACVTRCTQDDACEPPALCRSGRCQAEGGDGGGGGDGSPGPGDGGQDAGMDAGADSPAGG